MKKSILLFIAFISILNLAHPQAGQLDSSFGNNGIVTSHFTGTLEFASLAIQEDGKLVAVGNTLIELKYGFSIVRYNTNGNLDSTFSGDGVQMVDFGSKVNYAESVAIQKDGKIVVAGYASTGSNTSYDNYAFALARFNTDGSLDSAFSQNGKVLLDFGSGDDVAKSVTVQSDGKIVVAGYAYADNSFNFAAARFNIDGSLDKSFSNDGIVITDMGYNDYANSMVLQSDGKILVAGSSIKPVYFEERVALARYNSDGSLDTTFLYDQKDTSVIFPTDQFKVESIALQADGKIVVGGTVSNQRRFLFLSRYNADGTIDSTFSKDGMLITEQSDGEMGMAVTIQSDGKILLGGGFFNGNEEDFWLARYISDGSPDKGFGSEGIQTTTIGYSDASIADLAIARNNIYAVGSSYRSGVVAKYHLDDNVKTPVVTLSIPDSIVKYMAPARIKLRAAVANANSKVTKVRFYSNTTLIHTETAAPYGFLWTDVPAGNYTLTAKAYDAAGNVITSNAIKVSVALPVVSIVNPMHDTTLSGPATIRLSARAKDLNDRISKVEFFSGAVLLRTEYIYPYTYNWINIQPGTYTITAKATNRSGFTTTSAPVKITVTNAAIVAGRAIFGDSKTALSLKLSPNPTERILQVSAAGLQQGKPVNLSIISASGVVVKTIQSDKSSNQIDVSTLVSGVYTVKVASGDKVMYKQFVKL